MKLDLAYKSSDFLTNGKDDFSKNGIGIIHFGAGAFHRAHQAVYTHDALAKHGGNWRILCVSLQSTEIADALNEQDCVYSLVTREAEKLSLKLIKSIACVEPAVRGTDKIFKHLASPQTHIVSMTVTEKAYGILREEGKVDVNHKSMMHDLANHDQPTGVIGMIVKGLKMRKENGVLPFTVLCCDNLPQNGDLVRNGVIDFANQIGEPELAEWIKQKGAFPNSMVDRITPATTHSLIKEVADYLGVIDHAPIETEPFSQWVIEENFVNERPKWEDVGVVFVKDVASYERMKLRMLNGTHSLIAYLGFLLGHKFVRDVMGDDRLAPFIVTHIKAASDTLEPLQNINFETYAQDLLVRFKNPNIAHETYQIAMDGSQKMPQRIFEPALDSLRLGLSIESFAFATAAWIFYCSGKHENKNSYALRDPRESELLHAYQSNEGNASNICNAFFKLPDLFPAELITSSNWADAVVKHLKLMVKEGLPTAILASQKCK